MNPPTSKGRIFRLLPSVVLVGAAVLALKTSDLVHAAYAGAQQNAALSEAPVPANPDYADAQDDASASAAQVDVMSSLAKRRRELDARQSQIATQTNILAAAEKKVDAKIAQLKQLQAQITALLGERDAAQKAQLAALVKTYSSMKPKDAARIFDSLPDEVLIAVAQQMKSDALAVVLANMNPQNAQKLTVKLANRLVLPDTADALTPGQLAPGQLAPGQSTPASGPQTAQAAPATQPSAPQAPATAAAVPPAPRT